MIRIHHGPRSRSFVLIVDLLLFHFICHHRFSKLFDHCVNFLLLDVSSLNLWSHYRLLNVWTISFFLVFLRGSTVNTDHGSGHLTHSDSELRILVIFYHFSVLLFDNPDNLIIHLFLKNHFHLILNKIFNPLYDNVQALFNACRNFTIYSIFNTVKVLTHSKVIFDLDVLFVSYLFEHVMNM